MKRLAKLLFPVFVLVPLGLASCGSSPGGTEFGNPTREVEGTLTTAGLSQDIITSFFIPNAMAAQACPADTTIATDSKGLTTMASVASDCSFALSLTVNKAYTVQFVLEDDFVATLFVQNSATGPKSSVFVLSSGDAAIDLGDVVITAGEADPENDPASQNDEDEDAIVDFDDSDDDGDGVDDVDDADEEDCDLDGYDDSYDEEDSACDTDAEDGDDVVIATILQVFPENEGEFIALNETIEVLFDCEIDTATVSPESFSVTADTDTITCEYTFSESDMLVGCEHGEQDFLPATTYSTTIDGVSCADGTEVESGSWSWTTDEEA